MIQRAYRFSGGLEITSTATNGTIYTPEIGISGLGYQIPEGVLFYVYIVQIFLVH